FLYRILFLLYGEASPRLRGLRAEFPTLNGSFGAAPECATAKAANASPGSRRKLVRHLSFRYDDVPTWLNSLARSRRCVTSRKARASRGAGSRSASTIPT